MQINLAPMGTAQPELPVLVLPELEHKQPKTGFRSDYSSSVGYILVPVTQWAEDLA